MDDRRAQLKSYLEAWLSTRGEQATVDVLEAATVGLSQETWFVRIATERGLHDAVLRLPTPASGERAILAQQAALQLVAGRVPCPRLLWYDEGRDNDFGQPFLVMERVHGEVPVQWGSLEEPRRKRLAEHAMDVLAALHAIDPAVPADPARPSVASDLDWYKRRFERLGELPIVLRSALWWLDRHPIAEPARLALVHGDFRMGNMVVSGERIVGVLDWEMAAPGDPLADLAWCFIPVWAPSGVDEQAMVARYEQRSAAPVDEERLRYYRVLGYVRLAYYALSGVAAFDGRRSQDLRLAALRLQLPVHLDRLAAMLGGEPVR